MKLPDWKDSVRFQFYRSGSHWQSYLIAQKIETEFGLWKVQSLQQPVREDGYICKSPNT
jgi:hypothetical protein